jgi:hypothetical protein
MQAGRCELRDTSDCTSIFQPKTERGVELAANSEFNEGRFVMKATTNMRRDVAVAMASLLCASPFILSLSGCAEEYEYYADTYRTPEYRYNIYYGPDYYPYYPWHSYYGGAYYFEY